LTKADIVDTIATATGLTKVETEAVVDGFISTVINAMKEGKNITKPPHRRAGDGRGTLGAPLQGLERSQRPG
jgi:hypothetical protein